MMYLNQILTLRAYPVLFIFFICCLGYAGSTHAQTSASDVSDPKTNIEARAVEPAADEDEGPDSMKWVRNDYRLADVVAHVDVKAFAVADHTEGSDCDNNTGGGYCAYRLSAEVKGVYKGRISSATLEFWTSADAAYPKKYFLGEQIVFLQWGDPQPGKAASLGTMENSSRSIHAGVLDKLNTIVNPTGPIDENDDNEPYSLRSIKKTYADADMVVLADVVTFRPYEEESDFEPFIVRAKIKEVFKGTLTVGKTIEYTEDLLHRPLRQEDLGAQILYLKKASPQREYFYSGPGKNGAAYIEKEKRLTNPGRVPYEYLEYTEGRLIHGIVEKLRRIAKENRAAK